MSLTTLLEPVYLLQTMAVALSVFNVVAFLWLAFTVWLNGDRHSMIARVGVVGLGMAALFFFIHALLIANPFAHAPGLVSADFLWRLIWVPALGVPYIWFVIGLHYASLISELARNAGVVPAANTPSAIPTWASTAHAWATCSTSASAARSSPPK